jgi:hypothetical protein
MTLADNRDFMFFVSKINNGGFIVNRRVIGQ